MRGHPINTAMRVDGSIAPARAPTAAPDPADEPGDSRVHSRIVALGALVSPRDHSDYHLLLVWRVFSALCVQLVVCLHRPSASGPGELQRTATVTLARVPATLEVPGAQHFGGDLEAIVAGPSALRVRQDGHGQLLEALGQLAGLRRAPTRHHRLATIEERIGGTTGREADRHGAIFRPDRWAFEQQQRHVVVVAQLLVAVRDDAHHPPPDGVLVQLGNVGAPQEHLEPGRLHPRHAVRRRQNVAVVNQTAPAGEPRPVEQGRHPGKPVDVGRVSADHTQRVGRHRAADCGRSARNEIPRTKTGSRASSITGLGVLSCPSGGKRTFGAPYTG
uniref:Uncharacterized protein n=1 Tax=Anopheles atroparvus TaxID=41427 RepID=A0AAG5DAF5_ANOAO